MHNNIITDRTVIDVMAFTQNAKSIPYQDKDKFIESMRKNLLENMIIFFIFLLSGLPY